MSFKFFKGWWKKEDVINNPNALFVYGDNDVHKGVGGQAIIRYFPNTHGIPTKKFPFYYPSAYYTDIDYDNNIIKIEKAFAELLIKAEKYETIYSPEDGLGTGLANLPMKAPKTYAYIKKRVDDLMTS